MISFFKRKKRLLLAGIAILAVLCIVVLRMHEVDNSIKEEDRIYIEKYLAEQEVDPLPNETTYADQVDYIAAVQDAVLSIAPKHQTMAYPLQLHLQKLSLISD